jgi:hypothetical protein
MRACSSVVRFQANIRAQPLCAKNRKNHSSDLDVQLGETFSLDVC